MNELARYIEELSACRECGAAIATDGEYCEQCEINREAMQEDSRRE